MKVHWDHGTLDRNTAMEIIQNYGARDGQFLIRSSLNKEGIFVLSMAANGSIYNFEINKKVCTLALFSLDQGVETLSGS